MLIGAHVSPAGGPASAVGRGVQRGAHAIQIFNQNPRAWMPRVFYADEVVAFPLAECDELVGVERLGPLHLNHSATPLGSNRDRHANVGDGEIGADGCAVLLPDPRFEACRACSRRRARTTPVHRRRSSRWRACCAGAGSSHGGRDELLRDGCQITCRLGC